MNVDDKKDKGKVRERRCSQRALVGSLQLPTAAQCIFGLILLPRMQPHFAAPSYQFIHLPPACSCPPRCCPPLHLASLSVSAVFNALSPQNCRPCAPPHSCPLRCCPPLLAPRPVPPRRPKKRARSPGQLPRRWRPTSRRAREWRQRGLLRETRRRGRARRRRQKGRARRRRSRSPAASQVGWAGGLGACWSVSGYLSYCNAGCGWVSIKAQRTGLTSARHQPHRSLAAAPIVSTPCSGQPGTRGARPAQVHLLPRRPALCAHPPRPQR